MSRGDRKRKNPAAHGDCPFDAPDAIGVRAALDNLLHFHLLHSTKPFSAWSKSADLLGRPAEVEILIISDPKLLERVRKMVQVPTADPEVTVH